MCGQLSIGELAATARVRSGSRLRLLLGLCVFHRPVAMAVVLGDGLEGLVELAARNLNRAYGLNTCIAFTKRNDLLVVLKEVAAEITAHRGRHALPFYAA